jgi:hypothetical protein
MNIVSSDLKMTRTFFNILVLSFVIAGCQINEETHPPLPATTSTPIKTISLTSLPLSKTATPLFSNTPTQEQTFAQTPSQTNDPSPNTPADISITVTPALHTPFTVFVLDEAWIIEHSTGNIQLQFDNLDWSSTSLEEFTPLFYEGGPVLLHRSYERCVISLNFGGGVPFDWDIATEDVQLGGHTYSRSTFWDADGALQFVIYDMLFRITSTVESDACLTAAEDVLETYQLIETID